VSAIENPKAHLEEAHRAAPGPGESCGEQTNSKQYKKGRARRAYKGRKEKETGEKTLDGNLGTNTDPWGAAGNEKRRRKRERGGAERVHSKK